MTGGTKKFKSSLNQANHYRACAAAGINCLWLAYG